MNNLGCDKSWYFQRGNKVGRNGRPKGTKRLVRETLCGRIDVATFANVVNTDIERAKRGDSRALLRAAEVIRVLAMGDGRGLSRPWNTRAARARREL